MMGGDRQGGASPGLWGFTPPPMPEKQMGQVRVSGDPISGMPQVYWPQSHHLSTLSPPLSVL